MKKKKPKKPDVDKVLDVLHTLPEEVQSDLMELVKQANDPEEVVRLALVGDCPFCGSTNTRDCEEAPLDDPTVGICLDCSNLWCLECGYLFPKGQTVCGHWAICDACEFSHVKWDEGETCGTTADECSIIKEKFLDAFK